MSLTLRLPFRLQRALLPDGERRSFLIDESGMEDDFAALYVLSTIRNAGQSVSSQEAALNAINVLSGFCHYHQIDLAERLRCGNYLTMVECEALCNFAHHNFGVEARKHHKAVALGRVRRGHAYSVPMVAGPTYFKRLTHISDFLGWMAKYLMSHVSAERLSGITEMTSQILLRRNSRSSRGDDFDDFRFTSRHNQILNELIEPGAERNPFTPVVQLRNLICVELLRQTGMRRGEVLGLQVRDIDHIKHQLTVRRRHDSKDDPRIDQPVPKTAGRVIPISAYLTALMVQYVSERRTVPGATKHRYLLVTHKSGPTLGQPMSKHALNEVFDKLAASDDRIAAVHAHMLRHFFSNELARLQYEQGRDADSLELHRRVRNHLAGRKQTSDVDAVYTTMETERQARATALAVQERMVPLPKFPPKLT